MLAFWNLHLPVQVLKEFAATASTESASNVSTALLVPSLSRVEQSNAQIYSDQSRAVIKD